MATTVIKTLRGQHWAQKLSAQLVGSSIEPEQWLVQNTTVVKHNDYSQVGLLQLAGEFSYLKLYLSKSMLQSFWFRCGRGRAVHAFDVSAELCRRGVPVPEPRACLLVNGQQFLLKQGLADAVELNKLWLQDLQESAQRHWMQQSGQLLGQLHREGYTHGDAKWTNLLCQHDKLWLVDLDGVKRGKGTQAARDLARFTLNAEDRELEPAHYQLFLDTYLQVTGQSQELLMKTLRNPLQKLRARHLKQYGPRGCRLVE